VRKDAQGVLLVLVGATLIKLALTGTYIRYVKAGQLPLLLIAGIALLVTAAVTLWQAVVIPRRTPTAVVSGDENASVVGFDEAGEHGGSRVGWLLVIPALALLLFSPPAIGSFQADRNGTALGSQAPSGFAALPDGDPVRISVLDYASRAVFDGGRSLAGRRVVLSGFVIPGPNGGTYLARMIVTCCAADARPIKVGLAGQLGGGLAQGRWVEVEGTYIERSDRDPVNSETIPYLQVSSLREIAAPAEQYE
jgi:uncharacterized repeat protein (TIGR03943 family)